MQRKKENENKRNDICISDIVFGFHAIVATNGTIIGKRLVHLTLCQLNELK